MNTEPQRAGTSSCSPEGGPGREETAEERADRLWSEMLQEARVCQTGAQILFGFLLSVAFTPRFASLGGFDKSLYVVTVILGTCATAALIAPVSFHHFFAGHDLKTELVHVAGKLIDCGMVLLGLTIGAALLLLLRTATGHPLLAGILTGCVLAWFAVSWLVLPLLTLRRTERNTRRQHTS
ncbi:DUF6328 family protein [Kitasatospora sp. GP82]|uniref:DUF6328 family protein n=1 Tax=Kitasatospora sp. GP82 TaxID=3035089 RepID=UPI002476CA01|nr:DUF6328 family protein [Kitasatospora sp. GP82]MDH6129026.1 hypothetical protein [Kitasatospora sp. GP82]